MTECLKWLETLKKDGFLPSDLLLRKSFLEEGRGERFDRILQSLCRLVLLKRMGRGGYLML